jgi:hypothetical protein
MRTGTVYGRECSLKGCCKIPGEGEIGGEMGIHPGIGHKGKMPLLPTPGHRGLGWLLRMAM